jgi:hypothetical protein
MCFRALCEGQASGTWFIDVSKAKRTTCSLVRMTIIELEHPVCRPQSESARLHVARVDDVTVPKAFDERR